jgi:hypothetical protein
MLYRKEHHDAPMFDDLKMFGNRYPKHVVGTTSTKF